MQAYKCKCGKSTYWSSGINPSDCQGCSECGTNYKKEPIIPHDFSITKYDQNTGEPYKLCSKCYTSDKKLNKTKENK